MDESVMVDVSMSDVSVMADESVTADISIAHQIETAMDHAAGRSSDSGERRVLVDLLLAGLICLTAFCYWFWDTRSAPQASPPSITTEAKTVARDPFNDDGFRLFAASDYVGAEAQFRKAIRANPRGALGFCNLGAALIGQQRFDEAVTALQTAIALDPALDLARNNLGWAITEKAKRGK